MHQRRNFELSWGNRWVGALLIGAWMLGSGPARAQYLPEPVDPYSFEFEKSPPDVNIVSRQWQEKARQEKQEQFAIKIALPDAVKQMDDPREVALAAAEVAATAANSSLFVHKNRLPDLGLTALVLLVLALVSRKLAPMLASALHSRYNPWLPSPATVGAAAANLVAEEQSFSEFVAAFRIGPVPGPASPATNHNGVNSDVDGLKRFFGRVPTHLVGLRNLLQQIKPGPDHSARKPQLEKLRVEVRSLKGMAGLPELLPIWQMACAMEGLLSQLITKGQNVTLSTLRTVAQAVDLLESLSVPNLRADLSTNPPIRLLAVDDDPISRHAVSFALKKALNGPDLADNAEAAVPLCEKATYDAIFLDVQMPGMDGFELCTKIHQIPANRTTPVVFVTCQSDFEARAKSTLVGGHDLMGKPFLTFEITLKALTLVLRGRLERKPQPVAPEVALGTKAGVSKAPGELATTAKSAEPQKTVEDAKSPEAEQRVAESKAQKTKNTVTETKPLSKQDSEAEKVSRRKRKKRNERPVQPRSKDRHSRHGKSRLKSVDVARPAAPVSDSSAEPVVIGQRVALPGAESNGAPPPDSEATPDASGMRAAAEVPPIPAGSSQPPLPGHSSDTALYIRNQLNSLTTAPEGDRPEILAELCLGIHSLTSDVDRKDETPAFRLSMALQGILRKWLEKPDRATASALQTAGSALNLLDQLRRSKNKPNLTEPPVRIMIVDDDPVARRAITGVIQLSFAKPDNVESGELAVAAATDKSFDLIFLDIRMPGMDGFATCKKIRETSLNAKTPIVFITSYTDQELHKPSAEFGGNALIPKPAMAVEVTLTSLTHILRSRCS